MNGFTPHTLIENGMPCKVWGAGARSSLCSLLLLAACQPPRAVPRSAAGKSVYDTTPIDVSLFGSNADVRRRVLYMPFGEAASRLGAVHYEIHTTFSVSRGTEQLEQSDTYTATQDSSGNFHVVLTTPSSEIETYQVGEDVFVRHDKGLLRQKNRRDMDPIALVDTAVAVPAQALEQFSGATFGEAHGDRVDGRAATRYRVMLLPGRKGAEPRAASVPHRWHLPVQAPARWREQAHALDLTGWLSLDDATGVLLRADFAGRLEVVGHTPPTQLALHVTVAAETGHVATIKAPRAVAEFRRVYRQHDPLSFFRDQIPLPKVEESKPN